jgi:hypothetical protein
MYGAVLKAIFNSFIHPTQLNVILRDVFKLKYKPYSNKTHLNAAMDWLCRSQDISGCAGSSASYGFDCGWAPPYPETTGYIISTFLRYAAFVNDDNFLERAKQMGDWEIDIQLPSGAVRGGSGINDYPIVFNTGMVILGWTDLYQHTGYDRYLSASLKAADWLCLNIDTDGKWSKFTYNKIPHAYHSRVSWSLLEVYKHTNNSKYKDAAIRNINWVLSLVNENGWIEEMGFYRGETPLTHTIAYTYRGLLECSFFLDEEMKLKIQNIVKRAAERIMHIYEAKKNGPFKTLKLLPGRINNKWHSSAIFSCLTGNAQIAIIWLKIYQLNRNERYLNAAVKIIDQLKRTQNLKSTNPGIRGGMAGSYPIWGSYMRFSYPNWAVKFYADALMLKETVMSEIKQK